MSKVYFLFGVHNHQPIGNFDHIFKKAYDECYLPFIKILEKFPKIKCNIHNSGCLYDWLLINGKEYLDILKNLVDRGQVEIISGGYYEPILPIISDLDKYNQIDLMNSFIKEYFKTEPKGFWTAERVWEQYLARVIYEKNLRYTFLDDTHFRYAGLSDKEFFGYFTTEDDGKPIYIFPISKTLRYKIPFSQPHEAIALLESFKKDYSVLITLFDDGEKFGLWPHTFDWVYKNNWLFNFFSMLENSNNIETIKAHDAIEKFSSSGIIYLPTASYEEMGEWVLKPDVFSKYKKLESFLKETNKFEEFKDFIRGGFFRNFYHKYNRLNYMHKRMLYLSKKINFYCDREKDKDIFKHLFMSQTNCSYWHGIFGGFYLPHLREAVYRNLISAQKLFYDKYKKSDFILEEEDIDLCGEKELLIENRNLICCVSKRGGTILEFSIKEPPFNIVNTITKIKESYHQKILDNTKGASFGTIHEIVKQKEPNLDKFLIYDNYERLCLVDHIVDKKITLDDFLQNRFDTINNVYDLNFKKYKDSIEIVYHCSLEDLVFTKKIIFSNLCGFNVIYNFKKKKRLINKLFAVEFNLFLPSLKDVFRKSTSLIPLVSLSVFKNLTSFVILDNNKNITLNFKFDKSNVFTSPIFSVSSSEDGFEKVYQELSVLFITENKDRFNLSLSIKNGR